MTDRTDTITITGNVATPPESKRTANGVAITTFRVASGQRRYDQEAGAWVDSGTNWYTVSVFRTLADHAYRSLHKGDRVILTGRLRLRDWDNGTRRGTAIEIDADAIGHDLRWGTTTFVRASQRGPAEPAQDWPATGEEDTWAAPGVESTSTQERDDDPVSALVGTGSTGVTGSDDAETPF